MSSPASSATGSTHWRSRPEPPRSAPAGAPTRSRPRSLMTEQTSNPMREAIQEAISENPVILFMKGNPDAPACGFSARTVAILQSMGARFAAVDILPDPRIRQELSAISNWPTIPQLFVGGELIGGCDIVSEMYESGELFETLGIKTPDAEPEAVAATSNGSAPLSIENRL